MSDFIEGILEFAAATQSERFIREEKQVSNAIQNALSQVYLDDGDEIALVKGTIEVLNSGRSRHFSLESMFVHGNRSRIEFEYYGKRTRKELGDLVVVSTLTRHGMPLLQKMTIIQAKKDGRRPNNWGIDKEQLFFLSNWPQFSGVIGMFPKTDIAIADHSGCLGSYYLFREPGDFIFISARGLENLLGAKKRITFDELLTCEPDGNQAYMPFPAVSHPEELIYIWEKYLHHYMRGGHVSALFPYSPYTAYRVLQNVSFSRNINDAIRNFARLNIGEPVFAKDSAIPVNEFAYRMLNTIVRYVARQDEGRLGQLVRFNSDGPFLEEEVEMGGVTIGIIHTITEASIE